MGSVIKVGGMALPDGVMMRTDRAWAVARSDGSVVAGHFPEERGELIARIPVARVVVGLFRGLRTTMREGSGRRLLWGTLALQAVWTVVKIRHGHFSWPLWVTLGFPFALLVVIRVLSPQSLWRYHGAEHKAVTAYEAGMDLTDIRAVLRCSRVHDRCGTNIVVPALFALATIPEVSPLLDLPISIVVVAACAELVAVLEARPRLVVTRFVLGLGRLAQRWVTTAEPSPAQQAVGCHALAACLAYHHRVIAGTATDDQAPGSEGGRLSSSLRRVGAAA